MADSTLFDQLIVKLRTMDEVSHVIHSLEEFSGTFYSPKTFEEQQHVFSKLPKELGDILLTEIVPVPVTRENQIETKRKVDQLMENLKRCQNIKLTIAFLPNDTTISLFSDWVKKNIKPEMLIDLQFDRTIVGGALLISSGAYKDYSVKKKLSNFFQIQRNEIIRLLN